LVPIEQIKEGDLVLSKNTETGEIAYKPVEKIYSFEASYVYHITVGGEKLVVTGDHPFWIEGKGWVAASDLQIGYNMETAEGKAAEITNIEIRFEPARVYNFAVADFHTYYVTDLYILTHNLDCIAPQAYNILTNVQDRYIKAQTQSLATNLSRVVTKPKDIAGVRQWEAHHIVPQGSYFKREVRSDVLTIQKILRNNGIDLNSPANGMWLPKKPGEKYIVIDDLIVATHQGNSDDYIKYVKQKLERYEGVYNPQGVLEKLQEIRTDLLTGVRNLGSTN